MSLQMSKPKFSKEEQEIVRQVEAIIIRQPEDVEVANAFLEVIRKEIKVRKDYFEPKKAKAKQVHQEWVNAEKQALEPLNKAKEILTAKMRAYLEEERIKRKEEEQRLKEEAKKKNIEPDLIVLEPEVKVKQRISYVVEVADFASLPDEYKLPDLKKLNKLAQTYRGELNIPGIKVIEKVIIL